MGKSNARRRKRWRNARAAGLTRDGCDTPSMRGSEDETPPLHRSQELCNARSRHADNTLRSPYIREMILRHFLVHWKRCGAWSRCNEEAASGASSRSSGAAPLPCEDLEVVVLCGGRAQRKEEGSSAQRSPQHLRRSAKGCAVPADLRSARWGRLHDGFPYIREDTEFEEVGQQDVNRMTRNTPLRSGTRRSSSVPATPGERCTLDCRRRRAMDDCHCPRGCWRFGEDEGRYCADCYHDATWCKCACPGCRTMVRDGGP